MKILLAAKYAPTGRYPIGGVQTWVSTVGYALRKAGHSFVIWAPEFGDVPRPPELFDVGIISNLGQTRAALPRCRRLVVVSHGIIPDEAPDPSLPTAYTSEGVRDHWGGAGPVVRQPIDLEFWSPGAGGNRLFRYSYRAGLGFVADVAKRLSMPYSHLRGLTPVQARDAMRTSGCVLATGRAAVEAMACGVPVVICDHRSAYQGPLLDGDTLGAMARNYSGRGGVEPTPANVEEAVCRAMERGSLRAHVEQHHDARLIAEQLLTLAE